MKRFNSLILAIGAFVASTVPGLGAVLNHRLYRLGEADPFAAVGLPGDDPTVDSGTDAMPAAKIGLEFYGTGLTSAASLGMRFTNIDSRYVAPAAIPGITQDFGMEAYLRVQPGVTEARAFFNGGGGTPFEPLIQGYGIGVHKGVYAAFVGGAIFMTVPAIPGVAVEMAIANRTVSGGTEFDVYVQRALVLAIPNLIVPPPVATDVLSMGNFVGNVAPPAYSGLLDEARIFTFDPGTFDPSTDLGAAAAGFAGTPGQSNCAGVSVSVLARQFGGIKAAAAALGYPSVAALEDAIRQFCRQ